MPNVFVPATLDDLFLYVALLKMDDGDHCAHQKRGRFSPTPNYKLETIGYR
jgi:hypothetical protein